MKVKLRQKPITQGRQSLYLDYYPPIKSPDTGKLTRREFLDLFVYSETETEVIALGKIVPVIDRKTLQPKKIKLSPLQKEHNKNTLLLAENIRAQRQIAYISTSTLTNHFSSSTHYETI